MLSVVYKFNLCVKLLQEHLTCAGGTLSPPNDNSARSGISAIIRAMASPMPMSSASACARVLCHHLAENLAADGTFHNLFNRGIHCVDALNLRSSVTFTVAVQAMSRLDFAAIIV